MIVDTIPILNWSVLIVGLLSETIFHCVPIKALTMYINHGSVIGLFNIFHPYEHVQCALFHTKHVNSLLYRPMGYNIDQTF